MPPASFSRSDVAGSRPTGAAAAAYGAAALRNEVERVLAARIGTRNDTLNRAAYALGRLIGAGALDRDLAASELFHAARRVGLSARETSSTLASGLRAGIARPRYPARGLHHSAVRGSAQQPANREQPPRYTPASFGRDAVVALRAVDRAYDATALCAAPLVFSRDWRRIRALADALRDLRDTPRPTSADVRRAASLCEAVSGLAAALAHDFPAPGRRRARSPLGNALRDLNRAADAAIAALAREDALVGAGPGSGVGADAVGTGT